MESIDKEGELTTLRLGRGSERGDVFQGVAYAGSWFAAHLEDQSDQVCSRKMRRERGIGREEEGEGGGVRGEG